MSISSISGNTNYYQTGSSGNQHQKRKEELDTLKQALQSGDLTGAQQAFTTLQQDAPNGAQANAGDSITTDVSALGKALSSGDISGAQSAFATLQTDIQKSPPPGGPQFRNIAASTASTSGTSATTTSASSSNNADQVQQLFSQLAASLQSGDLAGAQTAFNSLQALAPDKSTASATTAEASSSNPFDSDIAALGTALQSGDLTSAQSAFATVQKDLQNAPRPHGGHGHHEKTSTTSTDSSTADSTTDTDLVQELFTQLAQALQSGNLSGAQSAFGDLQTLAGNDSTSANSVAASSGTTSTSTSTVTAGAASTTATTSTNSFGGDLNSLSQALQAGDLSSAQSAFTTLLTDLQNGGSQSSATSDTNTNSGATTNDWRAQQHLHFYARVVADRSNSNTVVASA